MVFVTDASTPFRRLIAKEKRQDPDQSGAGTPPRGAPSNAA
jgi:hypothetical protein